MANDVGIRVGVEGEKQFRDSLKGINSQLKNLNTELEASQKEFKDNADSQQALKAKTDILSRSIEATKQKVELLSKQYDTQSKKLTGLGEELDRVTSEFGANSKEAGKAQNAYNRQAAQVNNLGSQLNTARSDLSRFESQMQEATAQSDKLTAGLKSAASGLDNFSKKTSKIGNTLTLGVTTPLLAAGTASFKFASDLNENLNKTEVAFEKNADDVVKWSETTLKQYGLAQSTALEMAATWGDMGTSMEIPLDSATEMSKTLVGLAADMASFKNISIDRAQTALNAVYTGETESLKELGVVMTQANLEAYAMSKGIEKNYQDMSEAEKVTLRYQYVLDKTKNSQGDFARTSDSAANQMRIAQESVKELAAEFGQKLLPVGTKVLNFANDLLDSFNNLDDGTQQLLIGIGATAAAAGPLIKGISGITNVSSKALRGISNLTSKIKGLETAFKVTTASTGLLSKALGAVFSPAGLAVGATIGSLIAIQDSVEKTIQPARDLASAFADSAPSLEQYAEYIDNSRSALENFDITATQAGDKLAQYDGKINTATQNIHSIITTASEQSRLMTESEYEQIQNLLGMIDDYTKKKLEAYKQQQDVVKSMAEIETNMTKERSAELVKAAEETRNQTIAIANSKYQQMLAEAEQMYAAGTIEKNAYDQMRQNALNSFNQQKKDAETAFASTNAIISEKFFEQQILTNDNVKQWDDYFKGLNMLEADHQERVNLIRQQEREGWLGHQQAEALIMESAQKMADDRDGLLRQMVKEGANAWDEDTQNMISYWLTMASNTELYGGKVTDKEKAFVLDFGKIMDTLPDDMKEAAKNAMLGFLDEVEAETPSILSAAAGIAGGFINTIKNIFGIHSPSRVMRDLAKNVWKGWKIGTDYSTSNLNAQVEKIAEGINDSFLNSIGTPTLASYSLPSPDTFDYDAGREVAYAVERRINANINPERQQVVVKMADTGAVGTTLNQTNNFYSPEALSPAETARLNRNNVRATIRALGG